ncbi:MAG TPA: FecR domain-containing protein [bacterium]|nr:FecR domain-containing protein [bacterium]
MNIKHLTFERIVEVSENPEIIRSEEKLHIENCPVCSKRLVAAGMIAPALKKTPEVDPLVDMSAVEMMADNVFDIVSSQENRKGGFSKRAVLALSGVAALIIAVLSVVMSISENDDKKVEDTYAQKEVIQEKSGTDNSEVENVSEFQSSVIDIEKGSAIKRGKYEIAAKVPSRIVHEHENYYSVRKGVVEFKVQSGTDFMVNLNNVALVRVLGTVFTVSVEKTGCSVSVSEGLVEIIDLERGLSRSVAKGGSDTVSKVKRQPVPETVTELSDTIVAEVKKDVSEKISLTDIFSGSHNDEMTRVLINDLETALKFSDSPEIQLNELFGLYRHTGRWGSIIHQWNAKSDRVDTKNNPFLREMNFAACEASIKLYLYDNKVCKRYRQRFPEGPDPDGMEDHLKMAW